MKLTNRNTWSNHEFVCELTDKLDELAKLGKYHPKYKEDGFISCLVHYIYTFEKSELFKENNLPIRIPGGTVGYIQLSKDRKIEKIFIDTNYVCKSYPDNVNEIINKLYVGTVLEVGKIIDYNIHHNDIIKKSKVVQKRD